MIYDGAMDIVCHPVGNFNMLDATETWSGKEVPFLHSGAATCRKGFVKCFLRVPQAVGQHCSCHATQECNGDLQKTYIKTVSTSCRPRLYATSTKTKANLIELRPCDAIGVPERPSGVVPRHLWRRSGVHRAGGELEAGHGQKREPHGAAGPARRIAQVFHRFHSGPALTFSKTLFRLHVNYNCGFIYMKKYVCFLISRSFFLILVTLI